MHDVYNAFIDLDPAAQGGEGPLAGLTIGIKSNIAVAGLPWTAGMGTRRGVIASEDATVVARLRAAGATILGTLNMHEAALGATTDNAFYGRTHNPHRRDFTPGGSSGGSGAAVAAGLCDAALGTDTLGSIRIPAAYCGVYGLMPTFDAVSTHGLVPLGRRFDTVGPLARDPATLARVWQVIADDGQASDAEFERVLTLTDLGGVTLQPGVGVGYRHALDMVDLPTHALTLPHALDAIRIAALAEVARELIADLGEERGGDGVSAELKGVLAALERVPLAPEVLAETRAALLAAIGDGAVLVMPTAPQAAFAHGVRPPLDQATFTQLANIAGLPALAVPAGRDEDGLPVGVQLVGPPGSERRLLALAERLDPELGGFVPPLKES